MSGERGRCKREQQQKYVCNPGCAEEAEKHRQERCSYGDLHSREYEKMVDPSAPVGLAQIVGEPLASSQSESLSESH